jgi:hypothetical protein
MNLSLDANPTIYGDEHRPSLPGFKSLFGLSETGKSDVSWIALASYAIRHR